MVSSSILWRGSLQITKYSINSFKLPVPKTFVSAENKPRKSLRRHAVHPRMSLEKSLPNFREDRPRNVSDRAAAAT